MSGPEEESEPSLDQLSRAFAAAMGRNQESISKPPADDSDSRTHDSEQHDVRPDPDVGCPISPKTILEAILFVGHPENEPITPESVVRLLRGVDKDEVEGLVAELNAEYAAASIPFRTVRRGNGLSMQLCEEYGDVRERFYGRMRQVRLSQLAVDVLALVAYNQPVTREEVEKLLNTGFQTGRVLNQLVRRDLLARQTADGKPKRREYVTTERFLQLFDLDDIADLPRSEEPQ